MAPSDNGLSRQPFRELISQRPELAMWKVDGRQWATLAQISRTSEETLQGSSRDSSVGCVCWIARLQLICVIYFSHYTLSAQDGADDHIVKIANRDSNGANICSHRSDLKLSASSFKKNQYFSYDTFLKGIDTLGIDT